MMAYGESPANFLDLTNEKFGRLKVLYRTDPPRQVRKVEVWWACACDCGNFKTVCTRVLRSGATRSCGCISLELLLKHGCARTTGRPPEYIAWQNAKHVYRNLCDWPRFFSLTGPAFPGAKLHRMPDGTFEWRRGRKLSMKLAREIRASALEGKSNREIAKAFGIGKSWVSTVVRNETWKEAQ
jgi:hypothetical protein